MNFKIKSRDGKTSRTRQKVYFFAHPDDFGEYFDKLTDKILEYCNCDIYSLADCAEEDEAALKQAISEMSLAVFPVTQKFLEGDSRALNTDLRSALDSGVPILPILAGAESSEFNNRVGHFEALNINKANFESKFEKFFKDFAVDGSDLKRIYAEFGARLFLSYRKKDVAYAKKLIGILRGDKTFRDTLIWYDDYLTAGEDYNEEIAGALGASDMFVLLVTPNLTDGDNYVARVEYPEAVKANKPVVAVEAQTTDVKLLKSRFNGSYPVVSIDDISGLKEVLGKNLMQKLSAVKDTPEHKYYIGVAYCTGVGVDVDRALGVRLLSESADVGYLPAILKLIAFHPFTELINSANIVKWCTLAMKSLTAGGKVSDSEAYETVAGELVAEYIRAHKLNEAEKLISEMLENVGKSGERKAEIYEKTARLYFRMASSLDMRGDAQNAEVYIDCARENIEKLFALELADAPNSLYYFIMAMVAKVSFENRNAKKAVEAGRKAVERFSRKGERIDNAEKTAYAQFAVTYITILQQIGMHKSAVGLADEAEQILGELEETEIVMDTRSQLFETMGAFYFRVANGDGELLGTSLYYLREAMNIACRMSDDNHAGKCLRIAKYGFNYGSVLAQCNLGEEAVKVLDGVIKVCKNNEFLEGQRYAILKEATNTVAIELVSQEKYVEALNCYDEFIKLCNGGALDFADTSYDCANFAFRSAFIFLNFMNDEKSARAFKERAVGYIGKANVKDERVQALSEAINNLKI